MEINGTAVSATTLHNLFEFDGEYKTKLDFAKVQGKVAELMKTRLLLLDEISMIDVLAWQSICNVLSILADSRAEPGPDHLGAVHLLDVRRFQATSACYIAGFSENIASIV